MARVPLTDRQRIAVETVGRSLIVSAAAGSGKTTVLAERCAHLVCDAPPPDRCDVDQLLVLTFTDAAAAEMRGRIIDAIRRRRAEQPGDARLREQLALVDAARISTIHSFCLWVIRRWFNEAGVDPAAPLLDEHEAGLLRHEVLDEMIRGRYEAEARGTRQQATGGSNAPWEGGAPWEGEAPAEPSSHPQSTIRNPKSTEDGFLSLIDLYGLGDDREIARFVLRLALFVDSLPDPDAWLDAAIERVGPRGDDVILATVSDLRVELDWQIEYLDSAAAGIAAGPAQAHFYADQLANYGEDISVWRDALRATQLPHVAPSARLAAFDVIRSAMEAYEPSKDRRPNLPRNIDEQLKAQVEAAGEIWSDVKKRLWGDRLYRRFALFSVDEWRSGLARIAPHIATVAALVRDFRIAYAERKRRLGVLDFSDLERFALKVLREADGSPGPAARVLQRKFAYVLVDEFQDVSPIQDAIIRLASREDDPQQAANLFVVGDVKQSIYRFRLAEPGIFLRRLHELAVRDPQPAASRGLAVFLPDNFRSRREILEAVNILFRSLMTEPLGGIAYDRNAELSPGRADDPAGIAHPVEVHLLEAAWSADDGDGDNEAADSESTDDAPALLGPDHPAAWKGVEREAYLIGERLRAIMATERKPDGEPYRFRDAAILLRASNVSADKVAGVLTRMGIPAYADAGGSLMAALEIRDVLAALRVSDNARQDIPLAAVMRSGIFGERFSDDDLAQIRCHDRDIPFHEAVLSCADDGDPTAPPLGESVAPVRPGESAAPSRLGGSGAPVRLGGSLALPVRESHNKLVRESLLAPDALRIRLQRFLVAADRYRDAFRRRPLADVLWRLYEESGYLAYVSGLPAGAQRRANLLKLHDLARQFGAFRIQGLHRFLRFVDGLEDQERAIDPAPSMGEAEDVVRITSIHRSKGLEYPIVFVAGLGTQFNLADRRGRMIFERETGIGLRVVDPARMIEYESCARQRAAGEVERQSRAEELRILYVALTRARERLILVGSRRGAGVGLAMAGTEACATGSIPVLDLATASGPLDWILPALAAAPPGAVANAGQAPSPDRRFVVQVHDQAEMGAWRIERPVDPTRRALLAALAACDPLPEGEPVAGDNDPRLREVLERIEYTYPHLHLASVRSAMGASEMKRAFDHMVDPDERRQNGLMGGASDGPGGISHTTDGPGDPSHKSDGPGGPSHTGGPSHKEVARASVPARGQGRSPGPVEAFVIPASRHAAPGSGIHGSVPPGSVAPVAGSPPLSATERGTITHRVLQHLDFSAATGAEGVQRELDRLVAAGVLAEAERAVVDASAITWFVGTPLAEAIRAAGRAYHREFPFITQEPVALFEEWATMGGAGPRTRGPVEPESEHGPASTQAHATRTAHAPLAEHVLVRGIVDGILATADGLEILDFKTDAVAKDGVTARAEFYRPQMTLYARAMERLWQRPVRACRLVFLSARGIVEVDQASENTRM